MELAISRGSAFKHKPGHVWSNTAKRNDNFASAHVQVVPRIQTQQMTRAAVPRLRTTRAKSRPVARWQTATIALKRQTSRDLCGNIARLLSRPAGARQPGN